MAIIVQAGMDPESISELLKSIRKMVEGKPKKCNGIDKNCNDMQCCFYESKGFNQTKAVAKVLIKNFVSFFFCSTLCKTSFKNLQDELDAVVVNADDQETSTVKQVSQ